MSLYFKNKSILRNSKSEDGAKSYNYSILPLEDFSVNLTDENQRSPIWAFPVIRNI